jgi:hypothetical protein
MFTQILEIPMAATMVKYRSDAKRNIDFVTLSAHPDIGAVCPRAMSKFDATHN